MQMLIIIMWRRIRVSFIFLAVNEWRHHCFVSSQLLRMQPTQICLVMRNSNSRKITAPYIKKQEGLCNTRRLCSGCLGKMFALTHMYVCKILHWHWVVFTLGNKFLHLYLRLFRYWICSDIFGWETQKKSLMQMCLVSRNFITKIESPLCTKKSWGWNKNVQAASF